MVDLRSVEKQLRRIKFDSTLWNRAEARELPSILHENEKIFECANGYYEAGFALLVATDMRVLLVDKKPLNYLTVEDLRFDMINELDYSHRLFGATITIITGSRTLHFKSYNQPRLRKLINHVQQRMTEIKKEADEKTENQQQHLGEINKQLQMYLLAQQQQLQQQVQGQQAEPAQSVKPSPQLSDYLFAQRLLEQFQAENPHVEIPAPAASPVNTSLAAPSQGQPGQSSEQVMNDMVADGQREIFGKVMGSQQPAAASAPAADDIPQVAQPAASAADNPANPAAGRQIPIPKSLEINALKIAYSKLPMVLRNRKFGRPSVPRPYSPAATPAQTQTTA
jgi:hypothetical protein